MNRARKTTHDVVDGVPVTRVAAWLTIGAVAVAPALPLPLARADADLVVLHEPNPMALLAYFVARPSGALDRLVSQRGRAARLALPALLSSALSSSRFVASPASWSRLRR